MKTLYVIFASLVILSCQPDDQVPAIPADDNFDTANATLVKKGMLVGVGHVASGTASLYDSLGARVIVLDPYSSQNGPDLKVYLSKDQNASQYINLGPLKSITGKQSYDVTGMPDFGEYKFVLIWCQQYSVLFGNAEVQ